MKLSILICHLPERARELGLLLDSLQRQTSLCVEILTDDAPRGEPVGRKRNRLIDKAKGEYLCFIDDDDEVSGDYISSILSAIRKNPDCVGIEGIIQAQGKNMIFRHSIEFAGWYTGADAYYRTPNHLNPIRSDIVKRVRFRDDLSFGEDQDFSYRIKPFLKTEEYIDRPIYFYHSSL